MSGSFTSRDQALADPEYFEIELRMAPIWPGRSDGPWLYVEQARADSGDRPYRQRVYRLGHQSGPGVPAGVFISEVYTLPEPVGRFTGAWADQSRAAFAGLSPRDLTLLEGCTVRLRWDPQRRVFTGGTDGTGCASTRQGAAYTTSQIELGEGLLTSWDRGFDAAGRQVWGAKSGGYRFVKVSP